MKWLLSILLLLSSGAWAAPIDPLSANDPNFNSTLNDDIQKLNYQLININTSYPVSKLTGILGAANGGIGKDLSAKTAGSLIYFSDTGVMDTVGIGTTGYFLQATGTTPPVGWASLKVPYTAGDYFLAGDYGLTGEVSTSFVKHSEIYLTRSGTLRIKFWLINSVNKAHGQIYRNGVAVGTDQSSVTNNGVQFSEDISGWSAGDLLQLYIKVSFGGDTVYGGGLEIFEGAPTNEAVNTVTYPKSNTFYAPIDPTTLGQHIGKIGDLWTYSPGGAGATLYVKEGATTWTAK